MAVKAGHVQLKLIVPVHTRDVVRQHAEERGIAMSETIEQVVREVLEPELKANR